MPVSKRRQRPLRVEINPLLNGDLSSHASTSKKEEIARASPSLWDALSCRSTTDGINGHHEGAIGIVIEWPEDKRLPIRGKLKTAVLYVKPCEVSLCGQSVLCFRLTVE